uniref:TapB family protein n=1 Tax=Parabacteroides distasonis TaxID=823 RepID=UPI0040264E68
AQEPFFLHQEGVKLTYADKDKKGKINSYTETTATKVTGDADNCTVTYSMMVMDNKKNPVLKQPMTQTFEVKNGTVTYDPKSLVGQIMEGMQVTVTGTPFQLPSNVKVGDTFGDYTITLNLAGIKTNTEVTGVKAVAEETLDVNGTSIDCVVIENTTVSKVIGIKQTTIQKIWYGHGIGPVKTNMYNKKGKLMTSQELVSIEGL